MTEKIQRFKTIDELQKSLDGIVNTLKQRSEEFSKLIGEKIRLTDSNGANNVELQEFRQKIEGSTTDSKKKKITKKKDQKTNWHNLGSISVYDGIGLKGELELYFKAMGMAKSEMERLTNVKQAIDGLANRGLKRDLGCLLLLNEELPAEIAFTSSVPSKKKYTFKSIFNVPLEEPYEIKI